MGGHASVDSASLEAISALIPNTTVGASSSADQTSYNRDDGVHRQRSASPFVPTPKTTPSNFTHEFWSHTIRAAEAYEGEFKESKLPLARIKRVMKTDTDVKMISSEVPVLFAKACEIFISELTARAFLVATSGNRRTLHRADVAAAVGKSDMFDFLIDVLPREEPVPKNAPLPATTASTELDDFVASAARPKGNRAPEAEDLPPKRQRRS